MSRAAPSERDFPADMSAGGSVALPASMCSPQRHRSCPLLGCEDADRFHHRHNALVDGSLAERACFGANTLDVLWVEDVGCDRRRERFVQSIPIRLQLSKSRFMTIDHLTKCDALLV